MSPWWNELTGTYIGAFGGAGVGVFCGIYGAAAGILAHRGKARGAVLGFHVGLLVVGLLAFVAGTVAVATGQPYHVFYPLLLLGLITSAVMGGLLRPMRRQYEQAEHRRLEAEEIRRGGLADR